jgi:peptidoglycan/LPS O-acetylase OafA/YrhL
LIAHDGNRDNNFTTIRIVFAWLVLYGHSFALQPHWGIRDPLKHLFRSHIWVGEIAVCGFFAISGFLVTASLVKRGLVDYAISRVLRIYPALAVCVFATVFILGPVITNLSLSEYFSHPKTWNYLTNALILMDLQPGLPGVFDNNVLHYVNGSLWTLPIELICYLLLAALVLLGFRRSRHIANVLVLAVFALGIVSFRSVPLLGVIPNASQPALYFIVGVFLYLNRDTVLLDGRIALLAAMVVFLSFGRWFLLAFPPALIYLIFYVAYASRPLRTDAVVGDISYGVYIYAWPAQQVVAHFLPGQTPYFNTLVSSAIVIPLAWLSWHYVEKYMLAYKRVLLEPGGAKRHGFRQTGPL